LKPKILFSLPKKPVSASMFISGTFSPIMRRTMFLYAVLAAEAGLTTAGSPRLVEITIYSSSGNDAEQVDRQNFR
jgi:hypothetical protein